MSSYVENLYHYPIKGLTAQPLQKVALTKGQGFPLDRAFGFARPESGFDPNDPKPLPKTKFVMLAREEGLALLDTHFDEVTETLSIRRDRNKASFDLASSSGREAASSFLADLLGFPPDLQPTLHSAEPHKFTDATGVQSLSNQRL